ncbi:sterol esterase NDAI_0E01950 [Naumovozyma dairenensis CBS 421]|uniref:AB hydrolase-1 domain-containing protein n=1 Tax=Naumovozyma dairenensis (strain ATCC 10597 / BCRC 20456 / CBS 421 / NBRC 0211 / NRRL Y-12639) TaxID=1071378 RepID=G0WB91_NAUDC|nr:hypothetical protein NDAI_0E01950 [Naumovozyma dairenensis CBS 421]CCD25011.1 hypothetical protein NDAI_0E01950 [Naumovozyma dairenensis CBS 421]
MLVPFIGRISLADYLIIISLYIEFIMSFFLKLIPQPIINFLSSIINYTTNLDDSTREQKLRLAPTIHEMCAQFDINIEDHLVRTEDDYILTLHRIPPKTNITGSGTGKIVYLHHGLLMCSDIWCCQLDKNKNLPFVLHNLGYDVWMGNNRGNKYSTAHLYEMPKSKKFWDFSIDEFAFFDIPNSIDFILNHCQRDKLICIGFSQGSAQMFASFSINEYLNSKVSQFIAIAPAMTPKGLHNRIVDTFAKSSPALMYLFFGRNILLPSATTIWQKTLHPKIFNLCIDIGNRILFNWTSKNISEQQKLICYSKLYSTTSVKSVVHWFQILKSQKFQMFEASDNMFNSITRPYQISRFPTRTNIKIPILLIYGGMDSLVDIKVMKKNLPQTGVFDIKVENHEHLDLIWGEDTDTLVISKIIKFIDFFDGVSRRNSLLQKTLNKRIMSTKNYNTSGISTNEEQHHPYVMDLEDNTPIIPYSNETLIINDNVSQKDESVMLENQFASTSSIGNTPSMLRHVKTRSKTKLNSDKPVITSTMRNYINNTRSIINELDKKSLAENKNNNISNNNDNHEYSIGLSPTASSYNGEDDIVGKNDQGIYVEELEASPSNVKATLDNEFALNNDTCTDDEDEDDDDGDESNSIDRINSNEKLKNKIQQRKLSKYLSNEVQANT